MFPRRFFAIEGQEGWTTAKETTGTRGGMAESIGVFIIHPRKNVRDELRRILESYVGLEVVHEAIDLDVAAVYLASLGPEVIVMESAMNGSGGAEAVPEVAISISRDREGRDSLRELVVAGLFNRQRVRVMDPGSERWTMRSNEEEDLINAVLLAATSEPALTSRIATALPNRDNASNRLSDWVNVLNNIVSKARDERSNLSEAGGEGELVPDTNGHRREHRESEMVTGDIVDKEVLRPLDSVLSQESPAGAEIMNKLSPIWETREEENKVDVGHIPDEEDNSYERYMTIWDPVSCFKDGRGVPLAMVELVFPPSVGPLEMRDFILHLKRVTMIEIRESIGSATGGSAIKAVVDHSSALMEIIQGMPEVADALAESAEENPLDPFISSQPGPRKIFVELNSVDQSQLPPQAQQLPFELLLAI